MFKANLRREHLGKDAVLRQETSYGRKYEICGRTQGPNHKTKEIVSIWIVPANEDVPRFVTAYPGGN
jgi:hypothetical protein